MRIAPVVSIHIPLLMPSLQSPPPLRSTSPPETVVVVPLVLDVVIGVVPVVVAVVLAPRPLTQPPNMTAAMSVV
jgi:hypothetical protein